MLLSLVLALLFNFCDQLKQVYNLFLQPPLADVSVELTTAVWNLQNSSTRFDVTRCFKHVVPVLIVPTDKNMTFNRFTHAQLVVNQGKCGVPGPSTHFFVL